MEDDHWLNDLAFLVDTRITQYLAKLNVKLQGKEQYVNELYELVQVLIQKLEWIQKQLINKKIVHFIIYLSIYVFSVFDMNIISYF